MNCVVSGPDLRTTVLALVAQNGTRIASVQLESAVETPRERMVMTVVLVVEDGNPADWLTTTWVVREVCVSGVWVDGVSGVVRWE